MPWTLAHPAAVVPLRRVTPKYLDFAALVIGSVTPDLGYYIDDSRLSTFAHAFRGSFGYDVLPGMALYALFVIARTPVCFILPMPHRAALWPMCSRPPMRSFGHLIAILASLLLGAWTHIAWDAFTHKTGWVVQEVPILRHIAVSTGVAHLAGYVVLQHLSSLVGVLILAFAYQRWLVRQNPVPTKEPVPERWRYLLCGTLLAASAGVALILSVHEQSPLGGLRALRLFVFSVAVNLLAVAVPIVVLVSTVAYAFRRDRASM